MFLLRREKKIETRKNNNKHENEKERKREIERKKMHLQGTRKKTWCLTWVIVYSVRFVIAIKRNTEKS